MPALISGITVTAIALSRLYSNGRSHWSWRTWKLCLFEGFQRGRFDVTLIATIVILIIVFIIQFIGDIITNRIDKDRA